MLIAYGHSIKGAHKSKSFSRSLSVLQKQSEENVQAVINSVGSVLKNVADKMSDNNESAESGFTSLLSAHKSNDTVNFPEEYLPGGISKGVHKKPSFQRSPSCYSPGNRFQIIIF